jgi:hypothetical protein
MLALTMSLPSCAIPFTDNEGTIHHLVLGIGVVSVAQDSATGVTVTDATVLGAALSNQPGLKFGLGYSASTVTSVPLANSGVLVEVSQAPFGPLQIHALAPQSLAHKLP